MALTVHMPADVEEQLRAQFSDLDAEAKEAMLVEFYRQEKVTRHQLSISLGLSRFETDALLQKHHVTEDLPSSEELAADLLQARLLVNP